MSMPERAPEPTMDEILASIRRIIADEEPQGSPDPRPLGAGSSNSSSRPFGNLRERQKSGFSEPKALTPERPKASDDEDDILDLTKVLSESLNPHREEPAAAEAIRLEPAESNAARESERSRASEPLTAEELDRVLAEVAMAIDQNAVDEGAAVEDVAFEVDDVVGGPQPADSTVPAAPPLLKSARDDVDPESLSWDADPIAERDSSAEAWPSDFARRMSGGTVETGMQAEPFKAVLDDTSRTPFEAPSATPSVSASAVPNGSAQEPRMPSSPPAAAPSSTSVAASASKSLEDSVKEMLRPMLREWLDANMMRIVEETMREELGKEDAIQRRH